MKNDGKEAESRSAALYLPTERTIDALSEAAQDCHGCDLYQNATQAVFGAGSKTARMMFVGEQPGDYEDRMGLPFVGPAGRLLDAVFEEVGIVRSDVYVTNAVKHFKHEPRGKRRIHAKPTVYETRACRPWLEAELETITPEILVLLGATATQSLLGPDARVTQLRRQPLNTQWAAWTFVTVHPASLLRIPDAARRAAAREEFVGDLAIVAELYRQRVAAGT